MVRRLVSLLAACGVAVGGLTFGATPVGAAEGLTVSPALVAPGATVSSFTVSMSGLATGTWTGGFPYQVRFNGFTSSANPVLCSDIDSMSTDLGMTMPLPTKGAGSAADCSITNNVVSFHYEPSPSAEAIANRTVKVNDLLVAPGAGAYTVDLLSGSGGVLSSFTVCVEACPSGASTGVPPTITINIDANGGSCQTSAVTGYQGTWASAPSADACSRYGYTFKEFNTSADGSGLSIAPGGNLHLTNDNRLYAIYETPRLSGPPTDVVAVAGRNQVTVSWQAPADPGTGPITNYLVTANPSRRVCITSVASANPLSCAFDLPATNTQYTFTAQALNPAGWSESSTASNAVSPFNVILDTATRTQDRFLGIFKAGSTLSVSGRGPGVAPGTVITPQVRTGSGDWVSETRGLPTVAADRTISWSKKLAKSLNGTPVEVRLTMGDVASDPASLRVGSRFGVPDAPRNVKVVTERNGVRLSWEAPGNDGGSPITSYAARANVNGLTPFCRVVAGNPLTCVVPFNTSRVASGTTIPFTVAAVSARGEGVPAKASVRGPLR